MLFSATTTKKTEDLIKVALKKEPIYVGVEDKAAEGGREWPFKDVGQLTQVVRVHITML